MASLQTAREHYARSALTAQRASREALVVRRRGIRAVGAVVLTHQVAEARLGEQAVRDMLAEQDQRPDVLARLNAVAFTTAAEVLARMVDETDNDLEFARLIGSLVQSSGRAAESVAVTGRRGVQHVRHLSPPSCSRCAVLAGRVYRYSTGFLRHPGCDCVMVPVTVASPDMTYDPAAMAKQGLVTGMSKADLQAIRDGADLNQVVNVRSRAAGLSESGRVLVRAGRPTPEAIYRATDSQEAAVEALTRAGYLL